MASRAYSGRRRCEKGAAVEAMAKTQTGGRQGDKLASCMTMMGHLCSDINQGALSAILPFLVVGSGYSYTQAAMLIFAANIASAVIQPLFGWIGDRRSCPWFMALGVFLAGLGMCGIGYAGSYGLVVACAMLSGVGVAMFHPEGGRCANLAAGARTSAGMSVFAVGGNVGFFLGPVMTAAFLTAFGMAGTLVFLVPASVCALALLTMNGRFKALGTARDVDGASQGAPERWGMFGLVMGVLSLRSVVNYGLMAFVPLFLVSVLGQGEATASAAISLFSVAGAVATAASGFVSERVGVRRLMAVCLAAVCAGVLALALSGSVGVALALTVLLSVALDLFYPSAVALGMGYVPRHLGTASGMCYGVAICAGGVAEPFLGMAGDGFGLVPVMLALAAVAGAACAVALALGAADRRRAVAGSRLPS